MKKLRTFCLLVFLCLVVYASRKSLRAFYDDFTRKQFTVEQRLEQYGESSRSRWKPFFKEVGVSYPPSRILFVALKKEMALEVYASDQKRGWTYVRSLPVCAASGAGGPKLKSGDLQVPEGIYRISFLNANSRYHLSLRLNYPNAYDRQKGIVDGRVDLGGDIMIHGKCVSIGCLAMRDEAAEDLFVLAADVGIMNTKVVLAPFDLRVRAPTEKDYQGRPSWTKELYDLLGKELQPLQLHTS